MLDILLEKMLLYPKRSLAVAFAVFVAACLVAWWYLIWQNPQNVFEGMLAGNLTANSVTKYAHAGTKDQSVEQYARLQMGNTNAADWLVTAKQTNSLVTTENIATPSTGYIRYTDITTTQRNSRGKAFDFSSVLGVWGKSDGKADTSLNGLFSQTVLDVGNAPTPPIGNLPESARQNILTYMHREKIFTPDYKKVKTEKIDGRDAYTYSVSVKLGAYVRMMQTFAHDLGLHGLDTVDPSQYSTAPPLAVELSVDRASHQLLRVRYVATGFEQTYSDWGVLTPITLPSHTITTTELQQRLQRLQ